MVNCEGMPPPLLEDCVANAVMFAILVGGYNIGRRGAAAAISCFMVCCSVLFVKNYESLARGILCNCHFVAKRPKLWRLESGEISCKSTILNNNISIYAVRGGILLGLKGCGITLARFI